MEWAGRLCLVQSASLLAGTRGGWLFVVLAHMDEGLEKLRLAIGGWLISHHFEALLRSGCRVQCRLGWHLNGESLMQKLYDPSPGINSRCSGLFRLSAKSN